MESAEQTAFDYEDYRKRGVSPGQMWMDPDGSASHGDKHACYLVHSIDRIPDCEYGVVAIVSYWSSSGGNSPWWGSATRHRWCNRGLWLDDDRIFWTANIFDHFKLIGRMPLFLSHEEKRAETTFGELTESRWPGLGSLSVFTDDAGETTIAMTNHPDHTFATAHDHPALCQNFCNAVNSYLYHFGPLSADFAEADALGVALNLLAEVDESTSKDTLRDIRTLLETITTPGEGARYDANATLAEIKERIEGRKFWKKHSQLKGDT